MILGLQDLESNRGSLRSRPAPCAVRPRTASNTARLPSQVLVLPRSTQPASIALRRTSQRVVPASLTCPGWRAQPDTLTVHAGGARRARRRRRPPARVRPCAAHPRRCSEPSSIAMHAGGARRTLRRRRSSARVRPCLTFTFRSTEPSIIAMQAGGARRARRRRRPPARVSPNATLARRRS